MDNTNAAAEFDVETPTVVEAPIPTAVLMAPPARCPQCGEDLLVLDAGKCCLNEWCDTVWA